MLGSPPGERHRQWNWVGFWSAFVIVGLVSFLRLRFPFDDLLPHLIKVAVVTSVCSVLAGIYGDRFWHWLVRVLRW